MCFSATANFVGSGVLGAIGVATIVQVKHRREVLFASLPFLFAIHQFTEGFVWLGLDGKLSQQVAHNAGAAFVLYAQGLLPFVIPLSVMLFEPTAKRRRRMLPFTVLGLGLMLIMLWGLAPYPLQVYAQGNSIVYVNAGTNQTWAALLYVIATCGSLFFSEVPEMVIFGWANFTILLVTIPVRRYAFTSVWCAYAAIASLIICVYSLRSSKQRPFGYFEAM